MAADPTAARPGWFIYFKVPAAGWQDAADAVTRLHVGLRAVWPGWQSELLRRPAPEAGEVTLMEIYRPAPGSADEAAAFLADLARRVDAEPVLSRSRRHCEAFVPCA